MKKVKLETLADAPITERQKTAIYLTLQVASGNITQKEALQEAEKFNKYMNEREIK